MKRKGMMMKMMHRAATAVFAAIFATVAHGQGQEMPPMPVSVLEMTPRPLPVVDDLPGRVAATRIAEVRPRVGGIVIERVFKQGSVVQKGDILYRIDPAPYKARLASARGTLQQAEAGLKNAQAEATRQAELRDRKINSGSTYDSAIAALAQAEAGVAIANAGLTEAQLNLDYTEIRAPITGNIGRATITEGALVSAQTDVMATIQQLDPVYADFTQSASEVLNLRRALEAGDLKAVAPGEAQVRLLYDDGTVYEHPGRLLFSEATVDATTGQVTLRASFPNPEGYLLPGLYVRVQIEQATRENALLVPQMAVQRNLKGEPYVFVLQDKNIVEQRILTLGETEGSAWLVEEGLQPGEKIVVEGAQKLQPGATVAPEDVGQAGEDKAAPAQQEKPGEEPAGAAKAAQPEQAAPDVAEQGQ